MNMACYTKLFHSILASTIWREDDKTRIVWITMLAMTDQHGTVQASIPGLADLARVSLEECEASLARLAAPDKYSRTKDYEGRRIEEIDGGWLILNHPKYREKMNEIERREYLRLKKQESRERLGGPKSTNGQQRQLLSTESTHTDSDAHTDSEEPEGGGGRQSRGGIPPHKETTITPSRLKTLWNTLVPSLNPLREVSAKHLRAAKARGNESKLAEVFAMVEASDFLSGRGERSSHTGWKCTLDWVLKPDKFANIVNGDYNTNKPRTNPQRSDSANAPGRYD